MRVCDPALEADFAPGSVPHPITGLTKVHRRHVLTAAAISLVRTRQPTFVQLMAHPALYGTGYVNMSNDVVQSSRPPICDTQGSLAERASSMRH